MTATVPAARTVPSVAAAGWHRVKVELLNFRRSGEAVFFTLGFPPIMLALFGAIFGSNEIGPHGTSVKFSQYFTAGMIGTGVWTSCFQVLAIAVPLERDAGALKRLKATPMPLSAYFIGKIGQVTLVSAAESALLIAMGWLFYGLQLPSGARWLTFAWVFVLGTAACTLTGIGLGGLIRNGRVASSIVSPIAIILQFVSGVYFVFGELPSGLQILGSIFPLRWLTLGLRSVFLPDAYRYSEPGHTWNHLLTAVVLSVWCVIGFALARRTFSWMPERA